MTITRSQAISLLEPKISNIWHEAYPQRPVEYTSFVNIRSTRKQTVTDYKLSDFGPLRLKGEGETIIYDDPLFGPEKAYTPVRFGLGYKITQEMVDHELYGQVEKFERALITSAVNLQTLVSLSAMALLSRLGLVDSCPPKPMKSSTWAGTSCYPD